MAPSQDLGSPGQELASSPKKHNLRPRAGRSYSQNSLEASSRINKNSASSSMRGRPNPSVESRNPRYVFGNYITTPSNAPNVVGTAGECAPLTHHNWSKEDVRVEYDYDRGARDNMTDFFFKFTDWTDFARRDITRQLEALREENLKDVPHLRQLEETLKSLRKSMDDSQQHENSRDRDMDELVWIKSVEKGPGYKGKIDDAMVELYQQHHTEASRRAHNRWIEGQHVAAIRQITVFQRLIKAETLRTRTVESILVWIEERTYPDGKLISDSFPKNFIEHLFNSCASHDRKRRSMDILRSFFGADSAIPDYKREKILALIDEYYEEHDGESGIFSSSTFSHTRLESLAEQFVSEQSSFETLLIRAKRILNSKTVIKQDLQGLEERSPPPTAEDLIRPKISLLGSGMAVDEERTFLSIEYKKPLEHIPDEFPATNKPKNNYDVLTDFFTSPDVMSRFMESTDPWSLKEFTEEVNLLIVNPMVDLILEAFVGFCHKSQELFRITAVTRQIMPNIFGWQNCTEHPVAGPSRKHSFYNTERPSGIDKLEKLLLECAHNEFDRQVYTVGEFQSKMLEVKPPLLRGLIKRSPMGTDDLFKFLSYWSGVGRFFVFAISPGHQFNKNAILEERIWPVRNGWPAERDPEYTLTFLPQGPGAESANRRIEADVESVYNASKVRDALRLGLRLLKEHELYAYVYNREGTPMFLHEGVSRNQFHAFLRECNMRNRLFKLRWDGTVTILLEGRSFPGQNNNRNSVR